MFLRDTDPKAATEKIESLIEHRAQTAVQEEIKDEIVSESRKRGTPFLGADEQQPLARRWKGNGATPSRCLGQGDVVGFGTRAAGLSVALVYLVHSAAQAMELPNNHGQSQHARHAANSGWARGLGGHMVMSVYERRDRTVASAADPGTSATTARNFVGIARTCLDSWFDQTQSTVRIVDVMFSHPTGNIF